MQKEQAQVKDGKRKLAVNLLLLFAMALVFNVAFRIDPGKAGNQDSDVELVNGGNPVSPTPASLLGPYNLLNTSDATFTGSHASSSLGWSVAGAGDVNGDGYADFLVSAVNDNAGGNDAGRVFLFYGNKTTNWLSRNFIPNIDTANATFTGAAANDFAGRSVAGAGDVNGDGYDDFLIGADGYDAAGGTISSAGRAYLFYGNGSGNLLCGNYDLAYANVSNATFTGAAANDLAGYSLAGAGDVNGDGYDDFLIGELGWNDTIATDLKGRAYLFYGNSTANLLCGDYILSTATANATFTGATGDDYAGAAVAGAGDVNGDGYADFLVSAYEYGSSQGRVYLFYGNSTTNPLCGEYRLGSAGVANATFTGEAQNTYTGRSVAGAGDVNGDGYTDILIGAPGAGSVTGRAYLFYGNGSANLLHGNYVLGTATASATFSAESISSCAGSSVAGAGDVNGDGFADILIGANRYDSYRGRVYLFYGSGPGKLLRGEYNLTNTANATFTGETVSLEAGNAITGAGDVNGDGYADILIGAYRYFAYRGRIYMFFGSGIRPARIGDLTAQSVTPTSVSLEWTAPGEDGRVGTAYIYTLKVATVPITEESWASAVPVIPPAPAPALSSQSCTVTGLVPSTTYYFAIKTLNTQGNESFLSNVPQVTTPEGSAPIITAPPDISYMEGDGLAHDIAWTVTDPSTLSLILTIRINWGTPTAPYSWMPYSAFTFNAGGWLAGTYYVEITAADGYGQNVTDTVLVTVNAMRPSITAPLDISYTEGDDLPHNITWTVTDPTTSSPTYTVRVNWGAPTAPITWVSGTPVALSVDKWAVGVYYVEITAIDGYDHSITDIVVVTVQAKEVQSRPEPDWGLILAAILAPAVVALSLMVAILWRKMQSGQIHPPRNLPPNIK